MKQIVYICSVRFNTMANLEKIKIPIDIHSNTNATFDFIDENLPRLYSSEVYNMLPAGNKYEKDYIRKVKNDRIMNPVIVSYLYLVAEKNSELKKNK